MDTPKGTLVLVDGWNHFLAAARCFEYPIATKFPIDRLAAHVVAAAGLDPVVDVAVVMALPNRNVAGEEPEFFAWRKRLHKLKNFGVRHEKARFSYHAFTCRKCSTVMSRSVNCPNCATTNPVSGRRQEKGADIKLSTIALNGAWNGSYSALVLLTQDSDYGPMIDQVKKVHQDQGRRYRLYSGFPVCDEPGHKHRAVPGTLTLPLNRVTYTAATELPPRDPRPAATPGSPGSTL